MSTIATIFFGIMALVLGTLVTGYLGGPDWLIGTYLFVLGLHALNRVEK